MCIYIYIYIYLTYINIHIHKHTYRPPNKRFLRDITQKQNCFHTQARCGLFEKLAT